MPSPLTLLRAAVTVAVAWAVYFVLRNVLPSPASKGSSETVTQASSADHEPIESLSITTLEQKLSDLIPNDFEKDGMFMFVVDAFARLAREKGAMPAISAALAFARSPKWDAALRDAILLSALQGCSRSARLDTQELKKLLPGCSEQEAMTLLEYCCTAMSSNIPDALKAVHELWACTGLPLDPRVKAKLAGIILRRQDNPSDPTLLPALVGSSDKDAHRAVVAELASYLYVTDPGNFRILVAMAAQADPNEAVRLCLNSRVDGKEIRDLAEQMDEKVRSKFLKEYCSNLANANVGEAIEFAEAVPASILQRADAAKLCSNLLTAGAGRVETWLTSLDPAGKASLLDAVVNDDPFALRGPIGDVESAEAWWKLRSGLANIDGNSFQAVLPQLLKRTDKAPLREQAQRQSEPLRSRLLREIDGREDEFATELAKNPQQALAAMDALPDGFRNEVRGSAFTQYAFADPSAALELAKASAGPKLEAEVLTNLLRAPFDYVPLSVRGAMLAQHIESLNEYPPDPVSLKTAMQHFAKYDAEAGSKLCDQLPPGPAREKFITAFAQSWCRVDPVSASDWIATMPAGRERDSAVRELVSNAVDDPEIALLNANAIGDRKLRLEAAQEVIKLWEPRNASWLRGIARDAGFSETELEGIH